MIRESESRGRGKQSNWVHLEHQEVIKGNREAEGSESSIVERKKKKRSGKPDMQEIMERSVNECGECEGAVAGETDEKGETYPSLGSLSCYAAHAHTHTFLK